MSISSEQKKRLISGRGKRNTTRDSMEVTSSAARQASKQDSDNDVTAPMPSTPPAERQMSINPNRSGSGSPEKGAGIAQEKTFALQGYELLMKNFVFYALSGLALSLLGMVIPEGDVGSIVNLLAVIVVVVILMINAVKALKLQSETKAMMSEVKDQNMLRYFSYLKRYAGFSGWFIVLINVLPVVFYSLAIFLPVLGIGDPITVITSIIGFGLMAILILGCQILYIIASIYGFIAVFRAMARRKELRAMM